MNTHPIQINDRVYSPDHPEYGFGVVKLIDQNILDNHSTYQVAFDWIAGLTAISDLQLEKAFPVSSKASIPENEWGSLETLQRRLGGALAMSENSRTGNFIRSFITPLPHQAYLLEKIHTKNRLGHLIADDVGMGKTIEAGLIIAAMRQQDPRSRILILSPAGVVLQWQDEMEEHFGLNFSIVGRDFNPKSRPNWENHNLILASIDTLKGEHHQEVLKQAPPFDLIICDEAHRLTARREFLSNELYRTRNYRFVEWLVAEQIVQWVKKADGTPRSPQLLLLTATPHQGDDLRFAYLLQLVRPDQIEADQGADLSDPEILDECITRTAKKRAVDWKGKPIFKGHQTRTIDIEMREDEEMVLKRLSQYVMEEMTFECEDNPLIRSLAMHTFQKIAASSWAALRAALSNRLHGQNAEGDTYDCAASVGEEFGGKTNEHEKASIVAVLDQINALGHNSKWQEFSDLITPGNGFRNAGDRLLIFTQYRETQKWLAEKLGERGEKVALIHGALSLEERKTQRSFFESEASVLISTEAGSEGANLHRKCHLEINFDLPWNPMRLLQRIGRLDRYGQKEMVKVANLRVPGSWDSQISNRITLKLESIQESMGQVADEDYSAMIVGEIHDAIQVHELMQKSNWGRDPKVIEETVDGAVQKILSRKSTFDRLFQDALGMPEDFGKSAPELDADDFRQAFAWLATGQGVRLKETRTSDRRFLRGVFHFKLPPGFRTGLRPSREVYLVFDREAFSDVRGEVLGYAKGQEIRPSLAGFGDTVTDWFFRTGLHSGPNRTIFALKGPPDQNPLESWWISYAARWKQPAPWTGPDSVFTFALDSNGKILRKVPSNEAFKQLRQCQESTNFSSTLPLLEDGEEGAKEALRTSLGKGIDPKHLALFPLSMIQWAL